MPADSPLSELQRLGQNFDTSKQKPKIQWTVDLLTFLKAVKLFCRSSLFFPFLSCLYSFRLSLQSLVSFNNGNPSKSCDWLIKLVTYPVTNEDFPTCLYINSFSKFFLTKELFNAENIIEQNTFMFLEQTKESGIHLRRMHVLFYL